ncbi:aspartate aminotransferase family protein [Aequorivita antarctica]|uniref:Aspartate aminotransferase family protein n=1 Tax=Aequorivita antarctica TaxID=153266 RepID=A0A5C6YZD4_9FLAO|nr:aspartate aminotransferase family protein [Aequorivita antarctica]TXD72437.1 aspartate aminotransferase family protein [Aequorivita antarctica]SRX75567.1 Acetylornithine aminotransferase [Aequorivita antarctica]
MKNDFYKYQAQTTPHPLALEISHAKGSYVYDSSGKKHLDFVAGVSACTLGHCHPKIVSAIKNQAEKYLHVMVYGEYIQEPAVELAKLLAENLPPNLNTTYLVNSGTEAIEGALKLARRATGRTQLLYANNAYHGNTMGSMSVMGYEERKNAFKPLVPDCFPVNFNNEADLQKITKETAAIILETIQGGAGFIQPENDYLKKVRKRCDETGTLLILDEIQPGFGRTGRLFAFEHFGIVPDILVMGKGMGGGLPIGAFTASHEVMGLLQDNPKLGHITTFGGNPVIAAAALATLKELTETDIIQQTLQKEKLFRKLLKHPLIKEVRGQGLMLAAMLETAEIASEVILACKDRGLILFWLLFEDRAIRITPPLTISNDEIAEGCKILQNVLNRIKSN